MQFPCCQHGKVAGAGSHIENMFGSMGGQGFYGSLAPMLVNAEGEGVIEQVIAMGYAVKHAFNLFAFGTVVTIGGYFFLPVSHRW